MFNADRQLKFPFTGPVTEDVGWPWKAFAASILAFFPMLWFGIRFSRFKLTGRLFFMALIQLACGLIVWSATLPFNFYLGPFDWAMLILLFPAQIAILGILLINGFEFTEVLWRRSWVRYAGMALGILLLGIALFLAWLLGTASGLRFALARAQGFTANALTVAHGW